MTTSPDRTPLAPIRFLQNLINTFAMFVQPKRRHRLHSGPSDIALVLLSVLAISLAGDRFRAGPGAEFSVWGLQSWCSGMFLWVAGLGGGAALLWRPERAGRLIVGGLIMLVFSLIMAYAGLAYVSVEATQSAYFGAIYLVVTLAPFVLATTIIMAEGWWQGALRGLLIGAGTLGVGSMAAMTFGANPLFEPPYDETADDSYAAPPDPEVIYPAQEALLQSQLTVLAPQQPGQIDLYAVMGAGQPYQDVFMREIRAVDGMVQSRFDGVGRTVLLGNSEPDPLTLPLLNRTNLGTTLDAVAATMDPDQDILLLFLTSHGANDYLSTAFYGLNTYDLTAPDLAAALDATGIRNSVIIISACHAGSFIDDLAAPGRLIITAAAADRSSFGCANGNDWTDWGRAFFVDGLVGTRDFREASTIAAATVAQQEQDRGLTPSLPQTSEGAEISAVLDQWLAQFPDNPPTD